MRHTSASIAKMVATRKRNKRAKIRVAKEAAKAAKAAKAKTTKLTKGLINVGRNEGKEPERVIQSIPLMSSLFEAASPRQVGGFDQVLDQTMVRALVYNLLDYVVERCNR